MIDNNITIRESDGFFYVNFTDSSGAEGKLSFPENPENGKKIARIEVEYSDDLCLEKEDNVRILLVSVKTMYLDINGDKAEVLVIQEDLEVAKIYKIPHLVYYKHTSYYDRRRSLTIEPGRTFPIVIKIFYKDINRIPINEDHVSFMEADMSYKNLTSSKKQDS